MNELNGDYNEHSWFRYYSCKGETTMDVGAHNSLHYETFKCLIKICFKMTMSESYAGYKTLSLVFKIYMLYICGYRAQTINFFY